MALCIRYGQNISLTDLVFLKNDYVYTKIEYTSNKKRCFRIFITLVFFVHQSVQHFIKIRNYLNDAPKGIRICQMHLTRLR